MLVLKGNAFYEIDEECMRKKRTQIFGRGGKEEPPNTAEKKKKNQKKSPGEGAFFL